MSGLILLLLIGLWCSPVRWELDDTILTYSRVGCLSGDNFLRVTETMLESPKATCGVTKVERLGSRRWRPLNEMAFSVWANCKDERTSWEQKFSLLENGYLKVLSSWVAYKPNYEGPGRSLVQW